MKIDLSFAHDYSVFTAELPPDGLRGPDVHYLAAPNTGRGEYWSFAIEIFPDDGESWIGVFGAPDLGWQFDAVFSTPDSATLLAIADGQPFLVKATDPTAVTYPPCLPVKQAMALPALNMIVLAGNTDLVAVGGAGVLWQSGRLVTDDLKLVGLVDGALRATGFVGSQGANDITFHIDPATGRIIGKAFDV